MSRTILLLFTVLFAFPLYAEEESAQEIIGQQNDQDLCVQQRMQDCMKKCEGSEISDCKEECAEVSRNECLYAGE